MENKTYQFHVEGRDICVTTEETVALYNPNYGLTEKDVEQYAAAYVARLKYYKECQVWIDHALVKRLLEEEKLMKAGESDGFKLQLTFTWYVELKRRSKEYLPFQYVVNAHCLDNVQTFARSYVTMQAALLHCLNGLNENVSIRNRYRSIEEF